MIYRRAVLFDCGGTLIHMDPPKEKIVSDFLREEGINIGIDDVKLAYRIVDFGLKQSIESQRTAEMKEDFLINYNIRLFEALGLSLKGNQWARKLLKKFKKRKKWIPFPDTFSALSCLKQEGFLLGVVANWHESLVDLLDKINVSQFFSLILSSVEVNEEKPNPRIVQYTMRKMHITPDETFYIGDEYEVDVIVARRAGVEPVLIDRGNNFPYADCSRFPTLLEFANYLINIRKSED